MKTKYDDLIKRAVEKHLPKLDWRIYKAQLYVESELNPNAISPVGAEGLAQFMPATWEEWSPRAGFDGSEPTDPEAAIFTGAMYMANLHEKWHWPRPEIDRYCLALASYNAGARSIIEAQKIVGNPSLYAEIIKGLPQITGSHSKETIQYVQKIFKACSRLILD